MIEGQSTTQKYGGLFLDWWKFYRSIGLDAINLDFLDVDIPEDPGGFSRVLIMARGITPQSGYDLCAKNFPCWKNTDKNLDKIVISDRTTKNGAYAIRVRDRVEADRELKNLSANCLKEQNIQGITLEERFIYGLKFFKETGKHLDIENVTLCAGSRCDDGSILVVGLDDDGGMHVSRYNPDAAGVDLRSRQVVS